MVDRLPKDAGEYTEGLQSILDRMNARRAVWVGIDCDAGWYPILVQLDKDIAALHPDYEVYQVKEKFGGLRYYIGGTPQEVTVEVHKLISEAESLSLVTCELCGEPGTLRDQRWVRTLCDAHKDYKPVLDWDQYDRN